MCFLTHLILRIISSALTIFSNSLCSSSNTLSSFLSSVIRLSFSCRNYFVRNQYYVNIGRKQLTKAAVSWLYTDDYPSNGIRLCLKCPKNRTIGFLLKPMYLGLHIILTPGIWKSTTSRSPITCDTPTSCTPILMWRWKIIIGSCSQKTMTTKSLNRRCGMWRSTAL